MPARRCAVAYCPWVCSGRWPSAAMCYKTLCLAFRMTGEHDCRDELNRQGYRRQGDQNE
jgi:hypothetical protein